MTVREIEKSIATVVAERLVGAVGREAAHQAIDLILDSMPAVDVAYLAHDWDGTWSRQKQIAPPGDWRSWGFLTGRGFGKTRACAEFFNAEIEAGRIGDLVLCAQNEDKCVEIHVEGSTGLIETAPPWFRPRFEASSMQLRYPNGATAIVRTPEKPGNIRSGDHDGAWVSEIQSWPRGTMGEAWMNLQFATRRDRARMVWDATPKRRHPILKALVKRAADKPESHRIVRGTSYENSANLGRGVLEDLEAEYGGTQKGREELEGELGDEDENALVPAAAVLRRPLPDRLARRVVSVDPAVTTRAGSDTTGIVDAGLTVDGKGIVLGDHSGKHRPAEWGALVLDIYATGRCDCVVVETNKGGDLVTQNLRTLAAERHLSVVVLGKEEAPLPHQRGVVFVREVHARGDKMDRAQPVGTAYEKGRIVHAEGVDLTSLEETITTWEPAPGADSPGDLDALVHAMKELLGLTENRADNAQGFVGIEVIGNALASAMPSKLIDPKTSNRLMAALLGGVGSVGGRI